MNATDNIIGRILMVALLFLLAGTAYATEHTGDELNPDSTNYRESLFPQKNKDLSISHFTWGAEIGSSIDLRGNNMSTFDIDVILGYKGNLFRTIGLSAGIHRAFGNKNTFIPINLLLRTSFRKKPSLFFMDLKVGYSINNISNSVTKGGFSCGLGLGINLAMSNKFQSHVVISYNYFHINDDITSEISMKERYVDLARISFGINF